MTDDNVLSVAGRRAICEALGLDITRMSSLEIKLSHAGVEMTAKFFVTDGNAKKLGEELRKYKLVDA